VIGPEQGRRLRLTACVQNRSIGALLTDLLDENLPSITELADAIRSAAADEPQGSAA
jgi:hypothetical protein